MDLITDHPHEPDYYGNCNKCGRKRHFHEREVVYEDPIRTDMTHVSRVFVQERLPFDDEAG